MISFIIPVYNGEKFISRCLESIFNQTSKDFEIIIINDGSTDNTDFIIKGYIEKYSDYKIDYITIENGGHGPARNLAIKKAQGDYIWFVDIDDKLYDDSSLATTIKDLNKYNPDMYIFSVYETDFKRRHKIWNYAFKDKLTTIKESPFLVFKQQWAWNKVLKKSFLLEQNIFFESKLMFEDIYFFMPLYSRAKSIYITTKIKYIYVKHADSLTASLSNFKTYPKALFHELKTFLNIIFKK